MNDNTPTDGYSLGSQPPLSASGLARERFFPKIPKISLPNSTQLINSFPSDIAVRGYAMSAASKAIFAGNIGISTPDVSPILRKSALGTIIMQDLQFVSASGLPIHIPVDDALYHVHQAKSIVRTQIQGRDGRIKEYNGLDDYDIEIKGVICGENGVYPWDHVKNLVKYLVYGQSLGIVCKFLNELFDIHEIVVNDFAFEQPEGSQSYQKFILQAWSEKPIEVLIQESKV